MCTVHRPICLVQPIIQLSVSSSISLGLWMNSIEQDSFNKYCSGLHTVCVLNSSHSAVLEGNESETKLNQQHSQITNSTFVQHYACVMDLLNCLWDGGLHALFPLRGVEHIRIMLTIKYRSLNKRIQKYPTNH